MIWEIATTRIIGTLASLDLTSGQKTIKTIEAFFDGYIVLFGIPVILKLYLLWQQYLNTSVSNQFVRPFLILLMDRLQFKDCLVTIWEFPQDHKK